MNIMIIEDGEEFRTALTLLLELNGHSVLAADDSFDAIKLTERRPHFVFCDQHAWNRRLPGLQRDPETPSVPRHSFRFFDRDVRAEVPSSRHDSRR